MTLKLQINLNLLFYKLITKEIATTKNDTIFTPTTTKEKVTSKSLTSKSTTSTMLVLQTRTTFMKDYTSRCHSNTTSTAKLTSIKIKHYSNATSTSFTTSTSSTNLHRKSTERHQSEHFITSDSSYFPPLIKLYFVIFIRCTSFYNLFSTKQKI